MFLEVRLHQIILLYTHTVHSYRASTTQSCCFLINWVRRGCGYARSSVCLFLLLLKVRLDVRLSLRPVVI
jgi:hypothetical protein